MSNPLLDFSTLPRFRDFRPEHVEPAVADWLVGEGSRTIERLAALDAPPTWESFVEPLDDANEKLARAWAQASHLNAVVNTPQLREAYNAALPQVTQYFTEQGQDQRLHAGFRALRASSAFEGLKPARKRHVENELRDFRLGGAELPPPQKARFLAIQEELAKLASRFQDNVLDATNDFGLYVADEAELSGIPEDVLATARDAAKEGRPRRLEAHAAHAVLPAGHAVRRPPRAARADVPRLRDARLRVRQARVGQHREHPAHPRSCARRAAKLLGYASFAEVSLATKMAASPREVLDFLEDLARALQALRRARHGGAARLRARGAQPRRGARLRRRLREREAAPEALLVLRPGSEAVLPRGRGARGHVPRRRDDLRGEDPQAARPRRGTRRCASSRSPTPRARASASSTSTSTRAKPSGAARGWTTRSTAGASATACRRRSPSSPATSPRRWAASPRSSPTTR